MEEEKSYDKLWDEVFRSAAEKLVKVIIDSENISTTSGNMTVTIEQNELPDTRSTCCGCLPTSSREKY